MSERQIKTVEELEALYGAPVPVSLSKERDHLTDHYRAFVEAAPFMLLATAGPEGLDCSPRGDPAGFVHVEDPRTLLIPDRRGNNRLDSLKNIVRDPRIALLFLVPGVGETLRVNGRASILADEKLAARFTMQGKAPRSVIKVEIETVYYQCQKALARSGLWQWESWPKTRPVPTAGEINQGFDPKFDGAAYDRNYPEHLKKSIY